MKHLQRLLVIDGIDTAAECVANGPNLEVRLPCRYVSGYFPSAGPHRDHQAALFLGDVCRAVAAATVDVCLDVIAAAAPDQTPLAGCATREVAELEVLRHHESLLSAADDGKPEELTGAALKYAAAVLRLRAVRW